MDFASELAAKIGVAPVIQRDSDDKEETEKREWSDEEQPNEKTRTETKTRSDSSMEKKQKGHHEKGRTCMFK